MAEQLCAFKELGQFLEENHYRILIHNLTAGRIHQTPWARCASQRVDRLPGRAGTLLRLFHLSEVVEGAREMLGEKLADQLTEAGLLKQVAGGLCLGPFTILPFEGLLLITQQWEPGTNTNADHLWFGIDTCYVAKVLSPGRARRALELCTGVGTHTLVMASRGIEVCGVDLNPTAVRVATWNAWLNRLQERVQFHHGDLFEPVKGDRFDYVVASPPFLPSPAQGANELLFATAGPDGLSVMMRILDGLGPHLAPGGRALFLAAGFGDRNRPEIVHDLQRRAAREQWKVELILLRYGEARSEMQRLGKELPSAAADLDSLARQHGHDERYYSFLVAVKSGTEGAGTFEVLDCCSSWAENMQELRASRRSGR